MLWNLKIIMSLGRRQSVREPILMWVSHFCRGAVRGCVLKESFPGHNVKSDPVRGSCYNARCDACSCRLGPSDCAQAPPIAGLKAWEVAIRCTEVIPARLGVIEEFLSHLKRKRDFKLEASIESQISDNQVDLKACELTHF